MKDSNAAPSPNNSSAPNSARGKVAAPNAKAKAVSKAKARARGKDGAPKELAAPVKSANLEALKPATAAPETPTVAPAPETERTPVAVVAPSATPSESAPPQLAALQDETDAPEAKRSDAAKQEFATPEILFSEVSTPKIASSDASIKTTAKVAAPQVAAPQVAATKTVAAKAPANRTAAANTPAAKAAAPKTSATKAAVAAPSAIPATAPGAKAGGANRPNAAPVAARGRTLPTFRPIYVFAALAAIILTTAGGVAVGSYNHWSNSQVIAPKVQIAGEPIGGMTRDQAVAHLNKRFAKLSFTLQTDDKNIVLGLADIGGKPSVEPTVDKAFAIGRDGGAIDNFTRVFGAEVKPRTFSLPIEWNRGALTSRLQIVEKQYARPAVDARLVTVSGDAPRVMGEERGRALDVSATADAIQKSYYLGLGKVEAVTGAVEPKVTSADLQGTDVKLGEYRTEYNGGIAGRTTNIHVACRAIDGTVLMPGEVLSFNGLTGERTYKKGYRMAHIFLREKGESESSIVDGLAGGVCQVSSTLYNAVRKINANAPGKPLGIVERSSHSLPVTYVPSGRDATVAWPSRDFKFRNDNLFPVYVRTNVGSGRLTISIWGRVLQNQAVPVSLGN